MRSRLAVTAVIMFAMLGAAVAEAPSSGASSSTVKIGRFTFTSGSASGSPIKIGVIGDVSAVPQTKAMTEATAQYVNQKLNGLAGHTIRDRLLRREPRPGDGGVLHTAVDQQSRPCSGVRSAAGVGRCEVVEHRWRGV